MIATEMIATEMIATEVIATVASDHGCVWMMEVWQRRNMGDGHKDCHGSRNICEESQCSSHNGNNNNSTCARAYSHSDTCSLFFSERAVVTADYFLGFSKIGFGFSIGLPDLIRH